MICKTCNVKSDSTNKKDYKWLKQEFKKAHKGHKIEETNS